MRYLDAYLQQLPYFEPEQVEPLSPPHLPFVETLSVTGTVERHRHRYQRLGKNQLRVITVFPPLTTRLDEPVRCSLEHVSLEDLTEEYRKWEKKTDQNLGLQPRKARIAWIEDVNAQTVQAANGENSLRLQFPTGRAETGARYSWGDYVALSYCWGSEDVADTRQIILNGGFFQVTKNLDAALRFVRASEGLTPITNLRIKVWADAICINQDDDNEKQREIHRMKNIYGRSLGVFVHLGTEEDDSDHGIHILQRTAAEVAQGIDRGWHLLQHRDNPTDADQRDYAALMKVLIRPYWSRLWILQEIAMSDNSTVMGCGDCSFRFEEVVLATKFVWHNLESFLLLLRSQGTDLTASLAALNRSMWVILFIEQVRGLSQRLEDSRVITHSDLQLPLFNLGQNAQATLSHDKVFGLLAIMPEAIRSSMEDYTSYRLPVEAIFIAFSKAIIDFTGDLDIIYSKSLQQTMVPSWATDWRLPPHKVSLLHDWHLYGYKHFDQAYDNLDHMIKVSRNARADGGRRCVVQFVKNSSILTCSGILIGKVDGLASDMPDQGAAAYSEFDHIQPQQQRSPYGNHGATSRALVHTLFANPIWGDSDESSLFNIPWLSGESYSTKPDDLYDVDEGWRVKFSQMRGLGWDFLFVYGNYFAFEAYRRRLGRFRIGGIRFQDYFVQDISECSMPHDRIQLELAKLVGGNLGRRLITLTTGHFGLAPNITQPDDEIYVLLGCSLPVVLRKMAESSHYKVIGECYVEGFSNGEAVSGLDDGTYQLRDIALC
ncbi:heterokaryon incompatibility protein-domain-containing protein [Pyrenochaeta sp. MPI-SDFR-AT-0127]|nr:heterokaryon incompatibility protein-domain-containing protein [Pyrenochaeta sp. MPI-SDFR-AT-0127]